MSGNPEFLDDGKRYKIKIDDRSYYVIFTTTSVSVAYAFENREDDIKTRTILEKFCTELSKIMEAERVSQTSGDVKKIGNIEGIEVSESTSTEVC